MEEADQGSVKAKKKQADCDNRAGFRKCKSWASAGYCKKRSYTYGKEYMGVNCRKQCGCRGPPPPKAAVIHWTSNYKHCFDVDGGTPRKGASIWLWACKRKGLNQLFTIPPDGQAGQIKWATFPQMCLDVDDSKDKIGANIRIWRCSRRRPNQKFIVPARGTAGPIRWANHTEYCLVDGVGGNIQMGKCDDEDFYKEFNWGNPSEDGAREITYRKDLAKKTGIRHKVAGASTSLSIEEFGGR